MGKKSNSKPSVSGEIIRVSRESLAPSPLNPRTIFDAAYIAELGENLTQHGVINALLVRPSPGGPAEYEIIAGECRWRAAAVAGITELPAVVRDISDRVALELMLSENMQRKDLTPIEELEGFERALGQRDDTGAPIYTQTALAAKLGVSQSYVAQRLALRKLTKRGRTALASGAIPFQTARAICRVPQALVPELEKRVLAPGEFADMFFPSGDERPLSCDEVEELIAERFVADLRAAPFEMNDAALLPVAMDGPERVSGGACADCQWHSALSGEDAAEPRRGRPSDHCLNPACYRLKVEAHAADAIRQAREDGCEVMPAEVFRRYAYDDGTMRHNSPYVCLDHKPAYADLAPGLDAKKAPVWGKLVSGADAPTLVAVDAKGHVHRLMERKIAIAAAQANGKERVLSTSAGRGVSAQETDYRDQQKREREKAKARGKLAHAVLGALVSEIERVGLKVGFWEAVLGLALANANATARAYVVARRGLDSDPSTLVALADDVTGNSALALVVELLSAEGFSYATSPHAGGRVYPDSVEGLLDLYGVDVEEIKASQEKI